MEKYDPNIWSGVHTVRITLQMWEYVGHIIVKVRGNCKGKDILDFDFEDYDDFKENDCNLNYDEEHDCFTGALQDKEGGRLMFEEDARGMNEMIVAMEIIDYVEE